MTARGDFVVGVLTAAFFTLLIGACLWIGQDREADRLCDEGTVSACEN